MSSEVEQVGKESARHVRADIMQAAATLFAERGYNATSVREVVEAAGCKKPTLYYYFDNKAHLYLELIREQCLVATEIVRREFDRPGSVRARLRSGLRAYLTHTRESPTSLRLLMTAERHPEQGQPFFDFDAFRQQHVDAMCAILKQGVADGELRGDFPMEEAVLALFGIVDHRLVLFLHGRPIPEDFPERLLDLFFNGVAAR